MQSAADPEPKSAAEVAGENPFLQACSAETRSALLERGTVHAFHNGMLLYQDGQTAGRVLFPLSGSLQMSKTTMRGRRQVLCTLEPGSCNGICLLTMPDRGLADVRGTEPGHVLAVERDTFQALARQDPLLCRTGWQSACECMSHLGSLVEQLSFHKVAQRVAQTLFDSTTSDGDLVRLTQAELAAEVGTTREVVARCLAGLQRNGAIRLGRGRITVLARRGLEDEAIP